MNSLRREVFGYCPETCPDVEAAFDDMLTDITDAIAPSRLKDVEKIIESTCERVKEVGTIRLRTALEQAVSDKQDIEDDRDQLQREVDRLTARCESLEDEISSMERS